MKRKILILALAILCFLPINCKAGTNLVIEPSQTVSESLDSDGCKSIRGNMSVLNGSVDFYVISPSENIVLQHNDTASAIFELTNPENGTYTFCLTNHESTNVTAELSIGRNFEYTIVENVRTWHDVETWSFTVASPSVGIDLWGIISRVVEVLTVLGGLGGIASFVKWFSWWKKYRKPRTPIILNLDCSDH